MNDLRTIAKAAFAKEAAEAKNNGESKKKWRIDTECVAAAWYALRQALKIGGAAMVGEVRILLSLSLMFLALIARGRCSEVRQLEARNGFFRLGWP